MEEKRLFFDWAASAPYSLLPTPYSPLCGNPSSQHFEGREAKKALEDARERIASVLKVSAKTLYFTSGGTESNSIALFSNLTRPGKGRIISSLAEHASIREGMQTLERMGKPVGIVAIDSLGRVTPETLKKALEKYPDTRFVSIMAVNNETGTITDIPALMDTIREFTTSATRSPLPAPHFHCDLVQAVGKIPIDIDGWGIDSASISAHKIGGPRGIGLLYLRKPLDVFYAGGGQENGIRGGTENVQGAVALADCLEMNFYHETHEPTRTEEKRKNKRGAGTFPHSSNHLSPVPCPLSPSIRWKKLITSLMLIDRCTIIPKERTADDNRFSPFILQVAFKDIPGEVMARALDDLGFAVSTGAACSSSSPERPVLTAMGVEEKLRIEGIRISQGRDTTDDDIDQLLEAIEKVLNFL